MALGGKAGTATHGIAPGRRNRAATKVPLPANGALTLYTDGLTEGHNGATGERLQVEGFLELIAPWHCP